jgi:hypothetical protein
MNILSYYLTDDNFLGAISRRGIQTRRLFIIVPSMMAVMDRNSKSLQMTWQISPSLPAQPLVPGLSSFARRITFETGSIVTLSLAQTFLVWGRTPSSTSSRSYQAQID